MIGTSKVYKKSQIFGLNLTKKSAEIAIFLRGAFCRGNFFKNHLTLNISGVPLLDSQIKSFL